MFRTPLHWAAALGHTKIAAILLDARADFSSTDSNGATALHYAAQNNHTKTVEVSLVISSLHPVDLVILKEFVDVDAVPFSGFFDES